MSFNDGIKKLEEHLEELLGNGTFTQGEFEQVKEAIVGRIPTDRSEESLTSSEESPDRSDESLPCELLFALFAYFCTICWSLFRAPESGTSLSTPLTSYPKWFQISEK